jgi:glycosyltransferase involved in cell wall biosynthesis
MQTRQSVVSILMLTYNRAHFLPEAIDSVVQQTYQNWELVIIDDGSTDGTSGLMASYTDPRMRYIRHEDNAGLFVRRAESLSYATGTYTAILDSDDYWVTDTKLAEQVDFLENNQEHVIVGTQTNIIDEHGTFIKKHTVATTDKDIRDKILIRNQFVHSSLLIRTETLKQTAGYQPTLAEDLELILHLGLLGKLANLADFHTAHRVHTGSQNDHGRTMALAVTRIVSKYIKKYPNGLFGKTFSILRILRSYI